MNGTLFRGVAIVVLSAAIIGLGGLFIQVNSNADEIADNKEALKKVDRLPVQFEGVKARLSALEKAAAESQRKTDEKLDAILREVSK